MKYGTNKTGISMGAIIDVSKKNRAWQRKGKAKCTECIYLESSNIIVGRKEKHLYM